MEKGETRITIREGIQRIEPASSKQLLMDPASEEEIKTRIQDAIDAILDGTEYERVEKNPPVFGVEKES